MLLFMFWKVKDYENGSRTCLIKVKINAQKTTFKDDIKCNAEDTRNSELFPFFINEAKN